MVLSSSKVNDGRPGGNVAGASAASDAVPFVVSASASAKDPMVATIRAIMRIPSCIYVQRLKRSFSILNWSSALPTV